MQNTASAIVTTDPPVGDLLTDAASDAPSADHYGRLVKTHIKAGNRDIQKAEDHYKAAGILLAEYKAKAKNASITWPVFLEQYCNIKVRRANELIAIGDGRKTLAQIRGETAARVAAHAEKKRALANAQSEEDAAVDAALRSTPARQRAWSAHAAYLKAIAEMDDDERKEVIALLPRADDAKGTKERLQRARDTIDGLKYKLSIWESYLKISEKRVDAETGKRMFAEQKAAKLEKEMADLRAQLAPPPTESLAAALAAYDALSDEQKAAFRRERPAPAKPKSITLPTATAPVSAVSIAAPKTSESFEPVNFVREDWNPNPARRA